MMLMISFTFCFSGDLSMQQCTEEKKSLVWALCLFSNKFLVFYLTSTSVKAAQNCSQQHGHKWEVFPPFWVVSALFRDPACGCLQSFQSSGKLCTEASHSRWLCCDSDTQVPSHRDSQGNHCIRLLFHTQQSQFHLSEALPCTKESWAVTSCPHAQPPLAPALPNQPGFLNLLLKVLIQPGSLQQNQEKEPWFVHFCQEMQEIFTGWTCPRPPSSSLLTTLSPSLGAAIFLIHAPNQPTACHELIQHSVWIPPHLKICVWFVVGFFVFLSLIYMLEVVILNKIYSTFPRTNKKHWSYRPLQDGCWTDVFKCLFAFWTEIKGHKSVCL